MVDAAELLERLMGNDTHAASIATVPSCTLNPMAPPWMPLKEAVRMDRESREQRLLQEMGELQEKLRQLGREKQELRKESDKLRNDNLELDEVMEHLRQSRQLWEQYYIMAKRLTKENMQLTEDNRCLGAEKTAIAQELEELRRDYDRLEASCKSATDQLRFLREHVQDCTEAEEMRELESTLVQVSQDSVADKTAQETADQLWSDGFLKYLEVSGYSVLYVYSNASKNARYRSYVPSIFEMSVVAGMQVPDECTKRAWQMEETIAEVKAKAITDHDLQFCWMKTDSGAWVGVAACASSQMHRARAFGLGRALIYSALFKEVSQDEVGSSYSHNDRLVFDHLVYHVRFKFAATLVSVPDVLSLSSARGWLLENRDKLHHCITSKDVISIPVLILRWSQHDISSAFRPDAHGRRRSVHEVSMQMWKEWGQPDENPLEVIPALNVALDLEGCIWSLDNRRLASLRMLQSLVCDMVCVPCYVHKWHHSFDWKLSTKCKGLGISWCLPA